MLLHNAGAITIGHTDTPPMCQDIQTSNPVFGTTANPFDATRAVDGSSGGPAAAGFTSPEVGSDLADSPRLPAAYCGVYALCTSSGTSPIVPARGRVPRLHGWATSSYMIALGPIARTVEDLGLLLDVIAALPRGPGRLEDRPGDPGQAQPRPLPGQHLGRRRVLPRRRPEALLLRPGQLTQPHQPRRPALSGSSRWHDPHRTGTGHPSYRPPAEMDRLRRCLATRTATAGPDSASRIRGLTRPVRRIVRWQTEAAARRAHRAVTQG
ncbi:amidase family protein [Streptomyces sp. NPDC014735]|uniref:amidase family protein n=1 Tax=Streptomyces sp. NPDC014735 TaxID=3364887 RepID=UPI0036F4B861